jgi:hypothetical protein
MVLERTSVGLDVQARSIVGGVLDTVTGEVWSLRLPPATDAVLSWVGSLPGPVAVAYEAGPTGFGLARALERPGAVCGGRAVQAGTPARGSGQDRPARRRAAGPVAAHRGSCRACGWPPSSRRQPGIWSGPGRTPVLI